MNDLNYIDSQEIYRYFATLSEYLSKTEATGASGKFLELTEAVSQVMADARQAHADGNKLIFLGNGGSAAIASHMATDYTKNGNIRSVALNDSSMLTCLGNDLGFDQVFAKQVEMHSRAGDLMIAISSSGRSANILSAVRAALAAKCRIITLSGFTNDNPLRRLGNINFYIDSDRYGFVEIGHLAICHAILDFICGLRDPDAKSSAATTTAKSAKQRNARDS
jgi:D-sedoheptulose 7-phosphate isomerase